MKFLSSIFLSAATMFIQIVKTPEADFLTGQSSDPVVTQNTVLQTASIMYEDTQYRLFWFTLSNSSTITLYPNFESKTNSNLLFAQKNCNYLINGGFYSTNNEPIGHFFSDNTEFSPFQQNRLFNGFLYSLDGKKVEMSSTQILTDQSTFVLQTGPILIENSLPQNIALSTDKMARRSLFIQTSNDELFAMITTQDSAIVGPYLEDLPQILYAWSQQDGIDIQSAINLDGGTASAIISESKSVLELNPIGSYFCVQDDTTNI